MELVNNETKHITAKHCIYFEQFWTDTVIWQDTIGFGICWTVTSYLLLSWDRLGPATK